MNSYARRCGITDDLGNDIRVTTHRFRAYVTSTLISQGVDPVIVSMLLGHKSAHSLKHYARIYPERVHSLMAPVLEDRDWHIANMGNIFEARRVKEECERGLKPTNGTCAKPIEQGICAHANACYGCAFFVPDPRYKEKYSTQLSMALMDIEYARSEGLDRLAEANEDLVSSLEKVMAKLA